MEEGSLLLGKIHGVGVVWTEWKWLGIGSVRDWKLNRCAARCSMSSPTECLCAPPRPPPTHTHTYTLNCGSQYNLSSSVCVPRGTMAMQNEFIPVAYCVLRTLEHCITVTMLMLTQFCSMTAAYHTHPTRFLFCSNKLFVSSAVHRSYLTWILYKWCSKLCYELTENTLYYITKTNRLTLWRRNYFFNFSTPCT